MGYLEYSVRLFGKEKWKIVPVILIYSNSVSKKNYFQRDNITPAIQRVSIWSPTLIRNSLKGIFSHTSSPARMAPIKPMETNNPQKSPSKAVVALDSFIISAKEMTAKRWARKPTGIHCFAGFISFPVNSTHVLPKKIGWYHIKLITT